MTVVYLATISFLAFFSIDLDEARTDVFLINESVNLCKGLKHSSAEKKKKARAVAFVLNEVEKQMGVPDQMRGMTLSAACSESAFNPTARGDLRLRKKRNVHMAIGVLQLWPFYEKAYGTDRSDPKSSAIGWLTHIKRMVPKVRKQCKYRAIKKVWVAAWVTGIRYKKKGGRCKEKPLHLKHFLKLRKSYETHVKKSTTQIGR